GHSGPVLAASIATWMLFQIWPERIPRAWEITDGGFPLSAWQLIFVVGLLVGFHRSRIANALRPVSLIGWAVLFAVVIVPVRLIVKYWLAPDLDAIDIQELLFDKNDARVGRVLAVLGLLSVGLPTCGGAAAQPSPLASPAATEIVIPTPRPTGTAAPTPSPLGKGRVERGTFHSNALDRTMQFVVYLPPGYDESPARRYPTAYLLHGGGGDIMEWPSYGAFDQADRLMGEQIIPPYIIVLPEGGQEYWVDHVTDRRTGANGDKWGTYTAKEVVPAIESRYRTIARQDARA